MRDIRRRFNRSRIHLIDDYLQLVTRWAIWDSRGFPAKRLATSATDEIDSVRQLIESWNHESETKDERRNKSARICGSRGAGIHPRRTDPP